LKIEIVLKYIFCILFLLIILSFNVHARLMSPARVRYSCLRAIWVSWERICMFYAVTPWWLLRTRARTLQSLCKHFVIWTLEI